MKVFIVGIRNLWLRRIKLAQSFNSSDAKYK